MTQIEQEQELSKKYTLLKDENYNGLYALTIENVARVEAIIGIDSNYKKSGNPSEKPTRNYKGSTAYWMEELKLALEKNISDASLELTIYSAVCAVDRDNSTHLAADKKLFHPYGDGRGEMTNRLLKISANIIQSLQSRDFKIIDLLSQKTDNGKGRENYSFATKFCHYACINWFKDTPEADNYSIYDDVLARTLTKYANTYEIHKTLNNGKKYKKSDFHDYQKYSDVIDELRIKYGENISRNGFDHLLWYANKG